MNHYVYRLSTQANSDTELFYIGVRSSKCDPGLDTSYMGSSMVVDYMLSMNVRFNKQILDVYETRAIANTAEQMLFDGLNCIKDKNCINLHSFNTPYQPGRNRDKIDYFKSLLPQIVPKDYVDKFNKITRDELAYRVKSHGWSWLFIDHPERLKFYWTTTGTYSYWPGRPDNLMTDKHGKKKYYLTQVDSVEGTPLERITQLYESHYIKGQDVPVLEVIEQLMLLLNPEDWAIARKLVAENFIEYTAWIINRIDRNQPK